MAASLASEPDLITFLVTSGSGTVIASNASSDIGADWQQLDTKVNPAHVEHVINRRSTEVFPANNGKWLDGYSSLCTNFDKQSLRSNSCGFIFYRINLDYHHDWAIHSLRQQTLISGIGTFIGLIALLLVINQIITRRTQKLISTLKTYAAGDLTARADCRGKDELTWLGCSINNMLDIIEQSNIKLLQTNQQLEKSATTDSLTGLANRRYFDQKLAEEISRSARTHSPISLMLCDVDYFKRYNDTYGHQAGDLCLQKIAEAMKQIFRRSGDLPARYGGEEFIVILASTEKSKAQRLADSLIAAIRELKIPHDASLVDTQVTVSIGFTTFDHLSGTPPTPEQLIRYTDEALYDAKTNGRNRIAYADIKNTPVYGTV